MLTSIPAVNGATLVDLEYLGERGYLASLMLQSRDGLLVIDPGPTVSLSNLLGDVRAVAGSESSLRHVLLTHIHLDHGGCVGVLAERSPEVTIYVHERGAPHIADPSRLLASATRLYGDRMQKLWGDVRPVPTDRLRVVHDGESLTIGEREIRVTYTPGHAMHHAAYLDSTTGLAYVGDAAGERFSVADPIIPTTPPPDIDLEAWHASTARLRDWAPNALVLSHFGVFQDALAHLDRHEAALAEWAQQVRQTLADSGTDEERANRFATKELELLRAASTPEGATKVHFSQIRDCWFGLARYWRRKGS